VNCRGSSPNDRFDSISLGWFETKSHRLLIGYRRGEASSGNFHCKSFLIVRVPVYQVTCQVGIYEDELSARVKVSSRTSGVGINLIDCFARHTIVSLQGIQDAMEGKRYPD
jgi:hypothetical protein